jgi:clan AA aspartic protease (TIGR02281 family)
VKSTVSYFFALFIGLSIGWLGQQFLLSYNSLESSPSVSQSLARQYQRLNDLKNQRFIPSQIIENSIVEEQLSSKFLDAINQKNFDQAFEQFTLLEFPSLEDVLLIAGLLYEQERYELLFSFLYDYRYGLDTKSEQQLLLEIYGYVEQVDLKLAEEENHEKLVSLYRRLSSYQGDHTFYYLRLSYWSLQSGDTFEASQSLLGAINDISFVKEISELQDAIELYEKVGPQIEIPLRAVDGDHYLVNVELEGELSLELMIDTGASKTVVKKSLLDGMPRLLDDALSLQMNTANGRAQGLGVRLSKINIATLHLDYLDVVLMELPKFKYDGLLGMNLLSQFDFQIDQDNLVLKLSPKKLTFTAPN